MMKSEVRSQESEATKKLRVRSSDPGAEVWGARILEAWDQEAEVIGRTLTSYS